MAVNISKSLQLEIKVEANPVGVIDEKYICKVCNNLLCDVVQTGCCGEWFCKSCVEIKSSRTLFCPIDKIEYTFFNDKKAMEEICSLEFYCLNFESCKWKGPLKKLNMHLCACAIQKCEKYKKEISKKSMDEHNEKILVKDKQELELKNDIHDLKRHFFDLCSQLYNLLQRMEALQK
ncbi:TNF receptor-associated factor 4 [Hydra vulgaris]|uniref:TNF receptor-associated factor 4 n=1 Tax=Hydra vulgaris TaxID=6087 RepID=UPI001F5E97DA|nr:TNF receptor-associated factor 4-like [Hydra vulgaris]